MKKGQEEIVGFVVIVVLVAVALVILLGFSLRNDKTTEVQSMEVNQFLESASEYTTECALRYVPAYASIGDLYDACLESTNCVNGKTACSTLNESLNSLLNAAWASKGGVKGYNLEAKYHLNVTDDLGETITRISYGNCSGIIKGGQKALPSPPGIILVELRVCY